MEKFVSLTNSISGSMEEVLSKSPLVSVITITHNRANLLGRAIQSVLGQTYENIEHIIVDAASTDNTFEVVNSFVDSRLKYVKLEENYLPAISVNKGVQHSRGDFLCFLDDDDEYLPTRIQKAMEKFDELDDSYGLVYCWMTYYDSKTGQFDRIHAPKLRGFVGDDVVESPGKSVSGTPTYTFRRSVFLELGGWRTDIGIVSDWELAARLCQKWKVDYVPESLVKVYINHGVQRMSENGFYKNVAPKRIMFAEHFLNEFAHVYKKYPKRACPHYESLFRNHLVLRHWKLAWKYWCTCFKLKPSFRLLALWPHILIKKH